jgi:acetyl esterase/lipase
MKIHRKFLCTLLLCATASASESGTIHVPAFDWPPSQLLSAETRSVLERQSQEFAALQKECPFNFTTLASAADILAMRACHARHFYPGVIARYRARYAVTIEARTIGGVQTEIITPVEPIPRGNRKRLLINLHGGGFIAGARWGGEMESIPIAALGKIEVVSVDYRLAPEHRFPAASEDVAAVYKALLADYRAQDIGIFGCSAGGLLTAQAAAWFQKQGLPRPAAIGMFCSGAFLSEANDSSRLYAAMTGAPTSARPGKLEYIQPEDRQNPLAVPGLDPQVLGRFPATLLITSSRDPAMSSVIATHSRLVALGVPAELHVWEGLGHGFFYEPDLPESREAYDVIVRFFSGHLGGR